VNAGDAGGRKHARETLFGGGRFEGHTIKEKLVAGDRKQQSGLIVAESGAQFAPGGFILFGRTRMSEVIHPGELEQDVQAADKGASSRCSCVGIHSHRLGQMPPLIR